MKDQFVHLHTHSHYSLLNALPTIKGLVSAAKANNMNALALTDAGNMYGAIEFYMECQKQDIKPIIGVDFYVAVRTRHDKEAGIDNRRARLVLLAENETGYKNLVKLVTASYLEGFYYRPRIDHELISQHTDGLIAILPSFSSETSNALKSNDSARAQELIANYKTWYGTDNVFLELTHHPEIDGHGELMEKVKTFAQGSQTPLVAGHDVYYLKPEDRIAREVLMRIQGGTVDRGGFTDDEEDFSFISQQQANKFFKDTPEALQNTMTIAERCNLKIHMEWTFPNFIIESGREPDDELRHDVMQGVTWRGLEYAGDIKERLDYELEVIKNKGYATYFLVVGDLLREARERGILTTIRGSVAGSLTTYVLGITNVNPLEYKLPFERFLNPERPSAPDIDMDYADSRRDEIIQYARDKYGADNVAQIGTFGTMLARGVVRDVARALGYPYELGDQIAKLIPLGSQGFAMTIDRALDEVKELRELYKQNDDVKEVIDLGKKLEGNARHISVHAAGVVIAPKPLAEYVPIQYDPKAVEKEGGKLITQYDMHSVGEDGIGLLKFDFLGIKNLSILADSVALVKQERNIDIDIENIPLDDVKTFEMLARGETMGVFQLNGSGMTRFLKDLRPTSIHDINAMVALYRPGPMESIPQYIERKHKPHLVTYLDPRMKTILDRSFGVITYQDDVMMTAIKLAGYSWLEADKLRKAMGKKIPEVMAAEKDKLMEGLQKNGMSETKAEKLWKLIEPFAAYGFNKAHAASYGRVAYQTAYMKANYPIEYMTALLTADAGNVEKIAETITECERMAIDVLPPDVNESQGDFTIVHRDGSSAIRFGLHSIKNFGEGIADVIITARKKDGPFMSISNFLERIQDRNLNKKSLEALIKCGALDAFGTRGMLMHNIDRLLTFNKEIGKHASEAQDSLFGGSDEAASAKVILEDVPPVSQKEMLAWEKELLGLYISGHPLDEFREVLENRDVNIHKIVHAMHEGMTVVPAGIIDDCRVIQTKKGDRMAFIKITDFTGSVEVVLFPRIYTEYQTLIEPEHCIAIKGRISARNGEKSVIAEAVKLL